MVSSGIEAVHPGERKTTLPLKQNMCQGQQELKYVFISQMLLDEIGCVLLYPLLFFPLVKIKKYREIFYSVHSSE